MGPLLEAGEGALRTKGAHRNRALNTGRTKIIDPTKRVRVPDEHEAGATATTTGIGEHPGHLTGAHKVPDSVGTRRTRRTRGPRCTRRALRPPRTRGSDGANGSDQTNGARGARGANDAGCAGCAGSAWRASVSRRPNGPARARASRRPNRPGSDGVLVPIS